MTARQTEGPHAKKGKPHDPVQKIRQLLEEEGPLAITAITRRTDRRPKEVRWAIAELHREGLVAIDQRYHKVLVDGVEPAREEPFAADGGTVGRLVAAVRSDDVDALDITREQLYECLSPRRRREIIVLVSTLTEPRSNSYVETRRLAELLTERVDGVERDGDDADDIIHQHYVSVSQVHAPLLDDLGVLRYWPRVQKLQASETGVGLTQCIQDLNQLAQPPEDDA